MTTNASEKLYFWSRINLTDSVFLLSLSLLPYFACHVVSIYLRVPHAQAFSAIIDCTSFHLQQYSTNYFIAIFLSPIWYCLIIKISYQEIMKWESKKMNETTCFPSDLDLQTWHLKRTQSECATSTISFKVLSIAISFLFIWSRRNESYRPVLPFVLLSFQWSQVNDFPKNIHEEIVSFLQWNKIN